MNQATKDSLAGASLAGAALLAPAINRALAKAYYERTKKESAPITDLIGTQNILNAYKEQEGSRPFYQVDPRLVGSGQYQTDTGRVTVGPQARQFTLAHELGHQAIGQQNNLMQQVQQKTYHFGNHPLVSFGGQVAIGALVPGNRRALALSLGASYLSQAGKLASEAAATQKAAQYLEAAGTPISPLLQTQQVGNYAVDTGLSGMAGLATGRVIRSLLSK